MGAIRNTTPNGLHTSLSEVHGSIDINLKKGRWKRLLAFLGPAYLVSVGYMDPGNWATDIAGGSRYGYTLIWVLLMSNIMALLLQSLSARLGVVRGRDLAQASRETYSPAVNGCLYLFAEIAIAACDLAEVLGMAIGLQLLFDIPLVWGVCITVLDTFLLLFLINRGMRTMEAFILALVAIIGGAFLCEMIFAAPDPAAIASGFIPSIPGHEALYIAIGIIGATVMPHNLYLHSSLVQTRKFERTPSEISRAIRFNFIDSAIALNLAFFVNAAILVLAASAFYQNSLFDVSEIQDAYKFLEPLLGTNWAPILFAVALIAAGQSSTITGTLAGQIVMEGYLNLRLQPWIRRIITRLLAIVPALLVITLVGESATGKLLVLSQVVLSLQLGFAIIPLIHFVSDKKTMGSFAISLWIKIFSWVCATLIVSLNANLVVGELAGWIASADNPLLLWLTVVPLAVGTGGLLLYITFWPLIAKQKERKAVPPHGEFHTLEHLEKVIYSTIAVTVDFSSTDKAAIAAALAQGGKDAEYLIIHVVETAGALVLGSEIADLETSSDKKNAEAYCAQLHNQGYKARCVIGYGNPRKVIPAIVNASTADLLVIGAHGHGIWKDILFGTTVDKVRHRVHVPVFVVR